MGNQPSICQFKHQVNQDKSIPQECSNSTIIIKGQKFKYCQDHKCPYDNCKSPKTFGLDACQKHNCEIPTCPNCKLPKKKGRMMIYTSYCSLHVCKMNNCVNIKLEDEDFCQPCKNNVDKCPIESCYQPNPFGRSACHNHICQVPNCSAVITEKSTYCSTHKCQRKGCLDIVTQKNGFCRIHRPITPSKKKIHHL